MTQDALKVPIAVMPHAEGLELPSYASPGAAGMDLRAAIEGDRPLDLSPLDRVLVPTGIKISLPRCVEAQVRPRSGLAARHGISVLNSPGTIDSDYRGEIKVILINLGREYVHIKHGDRIAQLVVAPVLSVIWHTVLENTLEETTRGDGGFGSTGMGPTF